MSTEPEDASRWTKYAERLRYAIDAAREIGAK